MTEPLTVHSPTTLNEAYAILAEQHSATRIIAGGTDLMVLWGARQLEAKETINIWHIDALRGISDEGEVLRIGALTTYTQLINSPVANAYTPALIDAARTIGAIQIQNRGTIGGNIINASPAGDSLPVFAAFDAEVELGSARGTRRIDFNRFYTGYRCTTRAQDELLLAVRIPKLKAGERSFFFKVGTRRAQAISKVMLAAKLHLEDGVISSVSISLGSVAPTVIRATHTEELLKGSRLSLALAIEAQSVLMQEISPITDLRSTAHYRRTVAGKLLLKLLRQVM